MTLAELNALSVPDCVKALTAVCTAPRWAAAVAAGRPYASVADLQEAAADELVDADLAPALTGHPRIGDRTAGGAWAHEQAAVARAGDTVHAALAAGNAAYEARFGHVYLVCARGRSAEELLGILRARLSNDAAVERGVALTELAKINRLRLDGMVSP